MCYLQDFQAETELQKCSFKCESCDFGADEQIQKHFQINKRLFVVKVQGM